MNAGTLVLGLLNGLTIGLLAVGLVLVYKSNRFLNLAHAQLGALSAVLLAKWVLDWGWNWWLSFGLAIALGVAIGVLVDRFLVYPVRRRTKSATRLLLLSIGISQILLGLVYIPNVGPDSDSFSAYPQPYESDVQLDGVVLSGMSVLTAILVPILVAALAVFLKYSSLGRQIRAAASNEDAARLSGISVRRVSAITWGLAGGLAAVSAVLQAPTQTSFELAALGPYLLMVTLGAAAFGAFVSLPAALGGGLVLGLVSQVVRAETSSGAKAEVAVFLLILLVVLVRGKAIGRVFATAGSAVEELPPLRVPAVLAGSALVRSQRWVLGGTSFLLAILLPLLPFLDTEGQRFLLSAIVINALVGVALTMLLGWAGQVSLGHFAIVGLGAYLAGRWASDGWTLVSLLLGVGVAGAVVAVLVGLPALRVRGLTLAVTTLGFAVIAANYLYRQPWAGSAEPFLNAPPPDLGAGLGIRTSQLSVFYVSLVVLALATLAAGALRRSMAGRVVIAVRDNERASAAFGISAASVKLAVLAVSGFYAGMAGVLYAYAYRVVSPQQFTPDLSLLILAIPVIGGLGSLAGAIAAAVLFYANVFFLAPALTPLLGDFSKNIGFQLFFAGAGLVFFLSQYPRGLAGLAQKWWQRYLEKRAARLEAATDSALAHIPLATSGVRVRYGGVVALDAPAIEVRPGEIVGLIGPNGAGKTTLMNVISGIVQPSEGSVLVFGREVVDLPADLRAPFGLSRSFQDASLFGGLTVLETVQVALGRGRKVGMVPAMLGAPWVRAGEQDSRRRAGEILERFGLTNYASTLTSDLSTGTRRICDLAAQVASRPKVLLLDEPTGGVAQREAEAFGPLLRGIRDDLDCSILVVEHDMPLLMGLCDRVYAMEAGRVIAEGSPEQIRNDPAVISSYLGTDDVAISRSGAEPPTTPGPRTARKGTTRSARPKAMDADPDRDVVRTRSS